MKKHWNPRDFIETRREAAQPDMKEGCRYGYCAKCKGDMHQLYGGKISHFNSHQYAKRAGVL